MNRKKIVTMVFVVLLLIANGLVTESHAQTNPQDLLDAAGNGELGMVTTLLSLRADPNAADSLGNTAVMYAAQFGHVEVIGALAEAGADVNVAKADGWTALLLAAYVGQAGSVTELLLRGADMSAKLDVLTPLMIAAVQGHANVAEALIAGGAEVDETLDDGQTALFVATEGGHADVIRTLLEAGADPNAVTNTGATAVYGAIRNQDTVAIQILAEANAIFAAGLDEMPGNASCPEVAFPDSLQDTEISGQIIVEFLVDREGQTEDSTVTVLESPHDGLVNTAIEMFQGCVFSRGRIFGIPARTKVRQALNFGG